MSNTPRTDEIIKDFVSGNGEAASIMLLRQDVEQLENELADKDRQLAEARAEIEQLKQLWSCNLDIIGGELNKQLVEARADAEHWKSECNALQRMTHEARAEIKLKNEELDMFLAEQQAMGEIIEHKDSLIEQMREALKAIDGIGREAGNARREDALRCFAIAAAALAAEGGE